MSETEIGRNSIVCWSSQAVATEVNGEVVLMNLVRDRCHGLATRACLLYTSLYLERCLPAIRAPGRVSHSVAATLREGGAP